MKKDLKEQISRIKQMMNNLNEASDRKKENYYIKDRKSWVGGDTSQKRFDDPDDDYEDDPDVTDVDTLLKKYPDSHKHYFSHNEPDNDRKKELMKKFHPDDNPVKVKRLKKRDND